MVKAGTTSVFTYLAQHPDVCGSSVKEAQYFSGYRYGKAIEPIDDYRKLFSRWSGEKWVMEATPGYFEGGEAVAKAISQVVGKDTRILIILREPVDRFLSFFKYKKSMVKLSSELSLDEYVSQCEQMAYEERSKQENDTYWGLDGGFYSKYLPAWFEVFGDSIKVMFFDSLRENRKGFMSELCEWLDIDGTIYNQLDLKVENKSQNFRNKHLHKLALSINRKLEIFTRRWPRLKHALRSIYYSLNRNSFDERYPEDTLDHLRSIYRPYNSKLAAILIAHDYTNLPEWLDLIPEQPHNE